jgi:phage terminase small subunit
MAEKEIPEAPEWLTPGAKKLWRQVVPLIPDFNLILDEAAVSIYVTLLDQINAMADEEKLSVEELCLREELVNESFEWANELGLTPDSYLKITHRTG